MQQVKFVLRFEPIAGTRSHALAFPCDALGSVLYDELPEQARRNYYHALHTMGVDYLTPVVRLTH